MNTPDYSVKTQDHTLDVCRIINPVLIWNVDLERWNLLNLSKNVTYHVSLDDQDLPHMSVT